MICDKETNLKPVFNNLIYKKTEIIVDRLKKIRQSRLEFFNKNLNNEPNSKQKKVMTMLHSINTPTTYSYCRVEIQKPREEKHCKIISDINELRQEKVDSSHPQVNSNQSFIGIKYHNAYKKKLITFNQEDLMNKVRSMKLSRKNSEDCLEKNYNTEGENNQNKESFSISKPQLNSHRMNENPKNKMKMTQRKNKLGSDKLEEENRIKASMIKTKVSEILKNNYANREKKEASSTFYRKDNNIDFVSEYKMITEFVKTSKNNFTDHLYQKVSSNYLRETTKTKVKEAVSIVDCLALDNFNRIFNQASLPVLSPKPLAKSSVKNSTETHIKTFNKTKNINLKKIKFFNYLDKNLKVSSISTHRSTQGSVLNLNSIINVNKDEYSQTAR
jgi:hypothetical protein